MDRVRLTKLILWSITGLAAAVGITRFVFGLGATTNLNDATPWGFWIGFDVMGGVALAAGGFVLTAIVYIMKHEEFHGIVRPAVLTAFLGYLAVIFGLLFDLGLPWNIWHMIIYWNPHSPLFEVGWCVMLYTTVLMLEFSPVPLEQSSRYARIRRFLMRFRLPLVIIGIALSTLHQSSLGSLFLIMPFKLPALWYSNIIPILFFLSAIGLGLGMVTLESLVSTFLYRRKPEMELLSKLAKASIYVLGTYFVVRMVDIIISGKFGDVFAGDRESVLFLIEITVMVILPVVLFLIKRARNSLPGLWVGAGSIVVGTVFNRINVGGLTMLQVTGDSYIPSWTEIVVSAGVVSVAFLAFLFAIEKFNIWEKRPIDPDADPVKLPKFDRSTEVWLGPPRVAGITKYTLAFVISAAIGFMLIPESRLESRGVPNITVQQARGGDSLYIDGNRDGYGVMFAHEVHIKKNGEQQSCVLCHHMNLPADQHSACADCHSSMYKPFDAFRHDWHASEQGANLACVQCHDSEAERVAATAKKCDQCHLDLIPAGATIKVDSYMAVSYTNAMHGLCVPCHEKKLATVPDKPNLARCETCHDTARPHYLTAEILKEWKVRRYNNVELPAATLKTEAK
jgi:Ni/Fe-hydrogenase subunit HybB-like protein